MDIKKYISVGVCAVILLTSGLIGVESSAVKVRKKGKETDIQSVKELGEVLSAFAPKMEIVTPYLDVGTQLDKEMAVSPVSAATSSLSGADIKSAEISVSTEWSYTYNHTTEYGREKSSSHIYNGGLENATYYFSEDATYVTTESTYWFNDQISDGNDRKEWCGYVSYRMQWYADDSQALVRIVEIKNDGEGAMTLDGKTVETEIKTDEWKGIPLDEWLNVTDLITVIAEDGLSAMSIYAAIPYKSDKFVSALGATMVSHASEFKETKEGNGKYASTVKDFTTLNGLASNIFGFGFNSDVGIDDYSQSSELDVNVRISDKNVPTVYGSYGASSALWTLLAFADEPDYDGNVTTEIAVENVNCTFVKKLKSPKVGKIDSSAFSME